ncbi:MAG TPA: hypothetical protein VN665_03800 [Candidatus Paceibacterota bacterium]|nr:hypothetical protein [Candidatus Paceibacterota bacterium]
MQRTPVRKYTFKYFGGDALPGTEGFIEANNDSEFFSKLRGFFKSHPQCVLEAGSIGYTEFNMIVDPPATYGIRTEKVREEDRVAPSFRRPIIHDAKLSPELRVVGE